MNYSFVHFSIKAEKYIIYYYIRIIHYLMKRLFKKFKNKSKNKMKSNKERVFPCFVLIEVVEAFENP